MGSSIADYGLGAISICNPDSTIQSKIFMPLTLALIPDAIQRNFGLILFVLIVLAGIAVGVTDMLRFSWKRVWAIGSVCWTEAWRRRIWLIPPLAFLGVVIISQFQRPLDEQDAIRQSTKFCIFATGMVVAVTTIILACTNLPREIENRVIYSLVTKPTTRLEVVLGKVVGFASVSLTTLLIMGLLSYAYLEVRARAMQRHIAQRLETPGAVSAGSLQTLTYYREAGLLGAKKLEVADAVDVYSRVPEHADERRYFFGNGDGSGWVAFEPGASQLIPPGGSTVGENGLVVRAMIGYVRKGKAATTSPADAAPAASAPATTAPTTSLATGPTSKPYYGPFIMSPE